MIAELIFHVLHFSQLLLFLKPNKQFGSCFPEHWAKTTPPAATYSFVRSAAKRWLLLVPQVLFSVTKLRFLYLPRDEALYVCITFTEEFVNHLPHNITWPLLQVIHRPSCFIKANWNQKKLFESKFWCESMWLKLSFYLILIHICCVILLFSCLKSVQASQPHSK